jgi:ATP-dependent DNA helicase RecG
VLSLDIEQLRKILKLEQAKNYNDLAVMGGLDRYLQRHLSKARDRDAQRLHTKGLYSPNFSYAALSKGKRKEWAEKMLRQLVRIESGGVTTSTSNKPSMRPKPRPTTPAASENSLDSPITVLKGVSPTIATRFAKLGVKTIRDMLYFFPHRHLDYTQVKPISELEVGMEQTTVAMVWEARIVALGGRKGTEALVGDDTGTIRVVWFNQPYLARTLRTF